MEHFYGRSTSNPKHFSSGNESKNASLPQNLACLGLSIGFIFFVSSLLSSVDFRMSGSNFYFQFFTLTLHELQVVVLLCGRILPRSF